MFNNGVARTHHLDAIPSALSLDGDLITVFVSRTLAPSNVSVEESSDSDRDVSKGWSGVRVVTTMLRPFA
jgi:hypothetical protein